MWEFQTHWWTRLQLSLHKAPQEWFPPAVTACPHLSGFRTLRNVSATAHAFHDSLSPVSLSCFSCCPKIQVTLDKHSSAGGWVSEWMNESVRICADQRFLVLHHVVFCIYFLNWMESTFVNFVVIKIKWDWITLSVTIHNSISFSVRNYWWKYLLFKYSNQVTILHHWWESAQIQKSLFHNITISTTDNHHYIKWLLLLSKINIFYSKLWEH